MNDSTIILFYFYFYINLFIPSVLYSVIFPEICTRSALRSIWEYLIQLHFIRYCILLFSSALVKGYQIIESMLLSHFFFAFLLTSVYNKEAYNIPHQEKRQPIGVLYQADCPLFEMRLSTWI